MSNSLYLSDIEAYGDVSEDGPGVGAIFVNPEIQLDFEISIFPRILGDGKAGQSPSQSVEEVILPFNKLLNWGFRFWSMINIYIVDRRHYVTFLWLLS